MKKSVLFICLGNICRSPVAEGIFKKIVAEKGLEAEFHVESRGTGSWHIGHSAHEVSTRVAKEYGVDVSGHKAQQLSDDDIKNFDYLLTMDSSNYRDTLSVAGEQPEFLKMIRDYDDEALATEKDVPDPYYGTGESGFHEVHKILERSCAKLLQDIMENA